MRQRAITSDKGKNLKPKPPTRSKSNKEANDDKQAQNKITQRQYTKFNAILLDQHPHFVAYFKEDKNDKTKFLYTACQEKNMILQVIMTIYSNT